MEKEITIMNRKGKPLAATLSTPKDKEREIVIMTNSLGYMKDDHPFRPICAKKLSEEHDFNALRFDYAGVGKDDYKDFENVTLTSEAEDLRDVMAWCIKNKYDRFGFVGAGTGAAVALLAFDFNLAINAFAFLNPVFDLKIVYDEFKADMQAKGYSDVTRKNRTVRLGKQMWDEFGKLTVDGSMKYVTCPVLVLYGENDTRAPVGRIQPYFDKFISQEKRMELIAGAEHDIWNADAADLAATRVAAFMETHL